jgi:glycosyltransferase involved in cell wall biosynthesis
MRLSIIIPVYNEELTILRVIGRTREELEKIGIEYEIVVVDDGSTDKTLELLKTVKGINLILLTGNYGKGMAVLEGFKQSTGEIIVVQDADLEYHPKDLEVMYYLINQGIADVVYGSRFKGGSPQISLYGHHYLANRLISGLVNIFCNSTLSDVEVGYKMAKRDVWKSVQPLNLSDFGFEVEFTIKVLRHGWRIYEVGISYFGRTYEQGKKINWLDGVKALWYIGRYGLFYWV